MRRGLLGLSQEEEKKRVLRMGGDSSFPLKWIVDSESDVFAVWSERGGGGALDRSPNIDGRVNYN